MKRLRSLPRQFPASRDILFSLNPGQVLAAPCLFPAFPTQAWDSPGEVGPLTRWLPLSMV
ncbi:rCG58335 [Rattus norvegicus]|uniref:RCG58335 n=1 Tax=Rattus norvegicus TaxID=10116 RepID=A6J437_RAT|nr:rCG58335 [Rattus norvegicus]